MTLGPSISTLDPDVTQGLAKLAAVQSGTESDPALRSAVAGAQVVREAIREATILAYNDVFFVIGALAAGAFLIMLVRWTYDRRRGHNPLSQELAAMQKMRAGNT